MLTNDIKSNASHTLNVSEGFNTFEAVAPYVDLDGTSQNPQTFNPYAQDTSGNSGPTIYNHQSGFTQPVRN